MKQPTLYDQWEAGKSGFTGFGGFQTLILKAYREADSGNREILQRAYPFWFMNEEDRAKFEESQQLISTERRSDMLCNALEGGSNYWYYLPDTTMTEKYATKGSTLVDDIMKAVMAGEKIPVTDFNEDDHDKDGEHRLGYISKENMTRGEKLMREQQAEHFADIIAENDDASTGDVWFQFVVMGELVFG